jgi:hypothetical protein
MAMVMGREDRGQSKDSYVFFILAVTHQRYNVVRYINCLNYSYSIVASHFAL